VGIFTDIKELVEAVKAIKQAFDDHDRAVAKRLDVLIEQGKKPTSSCSKVRKSRPS